MGISLNASEYEQLVKTDTVKAGWGKTTWVRYNEGLILVNRAMFNNPTTNYMGTISLGIDNKYFETLYKGISNNDVPIADHTEDIAIANVLKEKNLWAITGATF